LVMAEKNKKKKKKKKKKEFTKRDLCESCH
jgi:hypothetical protein